MYCFYSVSLSVICRLVQISNSGAGKKKGVGWVVVVVVVDDDDDERFYTALFSALEQTHWLVEPGGWW